MKMVVIVIKACSCMGNNLSIRKLFEIEELNIKCLSGLLLCDKRLRANQTSEKEI